MVQFLYKAKEGPGKIVSGVIDAANVDNAVHKVVQLGFTPIDVLPVDSAKEVSLQKTIAKKPFLVFRKVSAPDIVLFTRQMADLVEASVPILRSLQLVMRQTQNSYFQHMIEDMHKFVKDGGSFSDALLRHSRVFSPLYINMVKTGEVSGKLETTRPRPACSEKWLASSLAISSINSLRS